MDTDYDSLHPASVSLYLVAGGVLDRQLHH